MQYLEKPLFKYLVCIWRVIYTCTCTRGSHACRSMHVEARGRQGYISLALSFNSLIQVLSLNLKLAVLARLAGQQASRICLFPLPKVGVTGTCTHTYVFLGCWRFILRSSCLHSKCSYPLWSTQPSPHSLYQLNVLHTLVITPYWLQL